MKINIPPVAQFILNVLLFCSYFCVLRFFATVIFSFFVVLYMGGNIGHLPVGSTDVFEFTSIILAFSFDVIILLTRKDHFYLHVESSKK